MPPLWPTAAVARRAVVHLAPNPPGHATCSKWYIEPMRWEDTVTIEAPPDRVWHLNTDVANWPTLTPTTMQRVELLDEGPLHLGSRARIKQPAQATAVWTVTHFVPGQEFSWSTKRMGMTMTGSHKLEP